MHNTTTHFHLTVIAAICSLGFTVAHALPVSVGTLPCGTVGMAPMVKIPVGKASVLKLNAPVSRILLGNPEHSVAGRPASGKEAPPAPPQINQQNNRRPGVADVDVLLLSPSELYLLGKTIGSTNVALLDRSNHCTIIDIAVGMDTASLTATLQELLPGEKDIKVSSAAESIVLSGMVSNASAADRAVSLASAYGRRIGVGQAGSRASAQDNVINMLNVAAPQQVMLEVKVAEVSKALLDQFGINFARAYSPADGSMIRFLSGILGGAPMIATQVAGIPAAANALVGAGAASAATGGAALSAITAPNGSVTVTNGTVTQGSIIGGRNATNLGINAQKQDGLVKVLAEPTVMAISGQTGDFLAGGRIFLPVATNNSSGGTSITLEEKTFGIGLKFSPTVLGDGRINLKLHSEVSDINAQGVAITATNVAGTSILPSFSVRSTDTTVQLMDGQSFAIGGLIKNNVTANITAFPFLGELPVLGALFRSTSFQNDRSELVFVITPRLVKPLPPDYTLPTDGFVEPSRADMILRGRLEGSGSGNVTESSAPSAASSAKHDSGGFEVK